MAEKAGKTYLKKVPENLWNSPLRKGIYKLYPGKEIEIENFLVKNETKEMVKIHSGKELPSTLTVEAKPPAKVKPPVKPPVKAKAKVKPPAKKEPKN